jgi:hypothetical protein
VLSTANPGSRICPNALELQVASFLQQLPGVLTVTSFTFLLTQSLAAYDTEERQQLECRVNQGNNCHVHVDSGETSRSPIFLYWDIQCQGKRALSTLWLRWPSCPGRIPQ